MEGKQKQGGNKRKAKVIQLYPPKPKVQNQSFSNAFWKALTNPNQQGITSVTNQFNFQADSKPVINFYINSPKKNLFIEWITELIKSWKFITALFTTLLSIVTTVCS